MCYYEPEECSDAWAEVPVRAARRTYTCTLCRMRIPQGTAHVRISELYEGRWTHDRVHLDCVELSRFVQEVVCEQHFFLLIAGDLHNLVQEHLPDATHGREVWSRYRRLVRARMREGVWVSRGAAA